MKTEKIKIDICTLMHMRNVLDNAYEHFTWPDESNKCTLAEIAQQVIEVNKLMHKNVIEPCFDQIPELINDF